MNVLRRLSLLLICLLAGWVQLAAETLTPGRAIRMGSRTLTLQSLDSLPYVTNDYSRRFRFESFTNPKLAELRTRHGLAAVVAPGQDEFAQQILLMDWTHRQFRKFGSPSAPAQGALEILKGVEDGQTFFCAQYAQVLVSAAASLGWVDRPLALRRHQGVNRVGGSTEHSTTEIWSNQHRKWVMLDPTSNLYVEKAGVPLNAVEIRQEWFYRGGTNLVFVVGAKGKRYRKADLPVFLQRFAGFGDLTFEPDEPDKYGFIGFIPNTDLMNAGYDYAGMFIVQDALCDGTKWHARTVPRDPAVEPYFPLGQAALGLQTDGSELRATLQTLTPNFDRFEVRFDGGAWTPSNAGFAWPLRAGTNRLEARVRNLFGVVGPVATAIVTVQGE
jgi:hypothetical protein